MLFVESTCCCSDLDLVHVLRNLDKYTAFLRWLISSLSIITVGQLCADAVR